MINLFVNQSQASHNKKEEVHIISYFIQFKNAFESFHLTVVR